MAGMGGGEDTSAQGDRFKKSYSKGKKPGVRIDMTPMVDVILLLLTFFILTTVLAQPQVMQINLPKGDEKDKVKVDMSNVLYIRVSGEGNIYFSLGKADGTENPPEFVAFNNVKTRLEQIYGANDQTLMLLKFSRDMKYSLMVSIIDEINRANIERRYTFMPMEDMDKEIVRLAGG
ncbi:MAG: biopolymer transporter ExbD [Ignavibacteriaceae bacterium]|jgi:Biopolymer transport protein|nr:MAG: biopolymer transporter ExbD [Chlorobiota bacterium]KXK06449.1 MAG: colicin uptake protein TolR [Chlorobi bacterium OLB4]MBV6399039.1 hypothetical protein [Ignavibacteria bacterium]MCC6885257.1 biopolymer transporter ExbD [Ignavibacteriales bacterium]MCE7953341.1 biopolymer transporter ExbD [Chlorobi bacterium CHB7]MDL1887242.1 biopolymer transporter ExbD [Ignavibacteria bacterium CHB1]MEB2330117.1 biopolymer transporter ExbD [Ignavibacteriaceae bacterium]OQY78179.1 MAG: hypothetical 